MKAGDLIDLLTIYTSIVPDIQALLSPFLCLTSFNRAFGHFPSEIKSLPFLLFLL